MVHTKLNSQLILVSLAQVHRSNRGEQRTKIDLAGTRDAQLSAKLLIESTISQQSKSYSKGNKYIVFVIICTHLVILSSSWYTCTCKLALYPGHPMFFNIAHEKGGRPG